MRKPSPELQNSLAFVDRVFSATVSTLLEATAIGLSALVIVKVIAPHL